MSAPTTHDPRFVNTADGACWERRAVTSEGRGLYAAAGSCKCPEFLLVPLSELAEHGIVGSADVLPLPVGPEPQTPPLAGPICAQAEARAAGLDIAPSVEELDAMASSIVAVGDPLSAEVSLAQAVPLLGAAVTTLRARVAELEAEKKRAAAHTEHMANCLVARTEELLKSEKLALPWAHVMSDGDLPGFLDDLVSAAMGRWRSEPEVPDRVVLADIEKVCADWRTPGQGYRSDDEPESVSSSERPVNELTAVFVPVASLREPEGEFHGALHHDYRVSHDLPETGGAS